MSTRAKVYIGLIIMALGFAVWGATRIVMPTPRAAVAPPSTPPPVAAETPHITAMLYYASSDGRALVPVRRDVPSATGVVEQGRQILTVQLQDAPQPYLRVVPMGTMLRAFYVTDRGDAFVDLSSDVVTAHPGGSFTELMTVYALVNVVTVNLPAIQRVQLLVDGKEVDTIAGHVDVRRPLTRDDALVRDPSLKKPETRDSKLKTQDPKAKAPAPRAKPRDSKRQTQD